MTDEELRIWLHGPASRMDVVWIVTSILVFLLVVVALIQILKEVTRP